MFLYQHPDNTKADHSGRARSNPRILGSDPAGVTNVCVRLFRVSATLYVVSGLGTGRSPVQGDVSTLYRLRN
jgi:hypothetical protein